MKKNIIFVVLLVVAGMSAGFAALRGWSIFDALSLRSDESHLRQRVEGYWDARKLGDVQKMAPYLHPDQKFVPDPGLLVTDSYEIAGLEISGDKAVATINTTVHIKLPTLAGKTRTKTLQDRWVRYQGEWYRDLFTAGFDQNIQTMLENQRRMREEGAQADQQQQEDQGNPSEKKSPDHEAVPDSASQ